MSLSQAVEINAVVLDCLIIPPPFQYNSCTASSWENVELVRCEYQRALRQRSVPEERIQQLLLGHDFNDEEIHVLREDVVLQQSEKHKLVLQTMFRWDRILEGVEVGTAFRFADHEGRKHRLRWDAKQQIVQLVEGRKCFACVTTHRTNGRILDFDRKEGPKDKYYKKFRWQGVHTDCFQVSVLVNKSTESPMGACDPRTTQDVTVMVNHWKDVTIWRPEPESARQHVAIKMGYRRPLTKEEHDYLVQIASNINARMEYTGDASTDLVKDRCKWRNGFDITSAPAFGDADILTISLLHKSLFCFWHFQIIDDTDVFVHDYDHDTFVERLYVVKQTEYQAVIKDKPTHLGITVTDRPDGVSSQEAALSLFDAGVRSEKEINKQKRRAARRARQIHVNSIQPSQGPSAASMQ